MNYFKDENGLLSCFENLDACRRLAEDALQDQQSVVQYCVVCDGFHEMSIAPKHSSWRDLRGQFVCPGCRLSARYRLLYEAIMDAVDPAATGPVLLFERITPFYAILAEQFGDVLGVEYGGPDLTPGGQFEFRGRSIQHEDMQNLSLADECTDLVVHSEVLEHVPDPIAAMAEVFRVLRPGGMCVFGCPVFTRIEHRKRAYLDANGSLVFIEGPSYHGDPLRAEGAAVFTEFGLSLAADIETLGFDCSIGVDHSLIKGYLSNNNPFRIGHMWPVVIKCIKP